jgi:hypothetical protein
MVFATNHIFLSGYISKVFFITMVAITATYRKDKFWAGGNSRRAEQKFNTNKSFRFLSARTSRYSSLIAFRTFQLGICEAGSEQACRPLKMESAPDKPKVSDTFINDV